MQKSLTQVEFETAILNLYSDNAGISESARTALILGHIPLLHHQANRASARGPIISSQDFYSAMVEQLIVTIDRIKVLRVTIEEARKMIVASCKFAARDEVRLLCSSVKHTNSRRLRKADLASELGSAVLLDESPALSREDANFSLVVIRDLLKALIDDPVALTPGEKSILLWKYEGYNDQEIAQKLGWPITTVRDRFDKYVRPRLIKFLTQQAGG